MPDTQDLLTRGGVRTEDMASIETAVSHHCQPEELARENEYWRLTWLLKDADGLDRVRLGDLDPRRLRFPESPGMVRFAQRLHDETNWSLTPGPDYFKSLWRDALALEPVVEPTLKLTKP